MKPVYEKYGRENNPGPQFRERLDFLYDKVIKKFDDFNLEIEKFLDKHNCSS